MWVLGFQGTPPMSSLGGTLSSGLRYCELCYLYSIMLILMLQTRYPILYCILVLPLTVVRFIHFRDPNRKVPIETFIFHTLFALSGVLNALLYCLTWANFFQGQQGTGLPPPPPICKDPPHTELGAATSVFRSGPVRFFAPKLGN